MASLSIVASVGGNGNGTMVFTFPQQGITTVLPAFTPSVVIVASVAQLDVIDSQTVNIRLLGGGRITLNFADHAAMAAATASMANSP